MELLLINHPLDCPVCDKGGECPLQNQAMSNGRAKSRFEDVKRTYPKPINISSQVLLDRERCVLCARCTRFSEQIAGDPFIALVERGALQQVGIYEQQPFESYFSGNTVQICPVGALTGAAYRFRSRPFDLMSTKSVCEHCASGCSIRTDHRRGAVLRRMAVNDPLVNEEWNCDKGRWAFQYASTGDRFDYPMVRDDNGELQVASWPEALDVAARGLAAAKGVGVLTGGRVSVEDAYAYGKFARAVLATNDIDFRARPHSAEEADFLAALGRGDRTGRWGGHLRRPRAGGDRGPRGLRARGGEPDRLPAAAQVHPPRQDRCVCRGALRDARPPQAGRHAHPVGSRHRGRGAPRAGRRRHRRQRRGPCRAGARDPWRDRARGRAPGHRARCAVRRRCPRVLRRCPRRLGAASRR